METILTAFRRYLEVGSTQATFSLSAGHVTARPEDSNSSHVALNVANDRGVVIGFSGEGADNATFDYRIWSMVECQNPDDIGKPTGYMLSYLGGGTATLGTATGSGSTGPVRSGERIADTVTFTVSSGSTTPKGPGQSMIDSLGEGSPSAYSPADNTPAMLIMPSLGRARLLIVEFDLTGATRANAFVQNVKV